MVLENGWKDYWKDRVNLNGDYYGKGGRSADFIIDYLKIKKSDVVLDIGCAVGAHLTDINKKTGAKCYGYDISPIAIKLNKNKKISLKVADMESSGYPSNMFTKVFSLGVFEHTPRYLNPYIELNRIMKINGLALITVPNKYSFFHITKNIKMMLGTWDLGYERSFTKFEMKKILKKTGFELLHYEVKPHLKPGNIFNRLDNLLNKINSQQFGFFIYAVIKKSKELNNHEQKNLI